MRRMLLGRQKLLDVAGGVFLDHKAPDMPNYRQRRNGMACPMKYLLCI
jgi:hypothetical protein